jgi:hypothetical protein
MNKLRNLAESTRKNAILSRPRLHVYRRVSLCAASVSARVLAAGFPKSTLEVWISTNEVSDDDNEVH